MRLLMLWLGVASLAAIIGCSDAQETKQSVPERNDTSVGNDDNHPEEDSCTPTKQCGVDEVFKCCGPCYQLTCYGSVIDCAGHCFAECYCVEGFVREYPAGRCIPEQLCQRPVLPILSDDDDDESF
uniref:Uncharacterized protein n=1 Tax=Anopheles stephensi TaxID=30069 RepID=A0A182XWY6_ANOST